MTFQIRNAQPSDAPALADLVREIGFFAAINAEPAQATAERMPHILAQNLANDSHSIYVAVDDADADPDRLLGYLSVHWLPYLIHTGPEGYISELFIREAARGQGIGTALLDVAVAEARRRGCDRMMLVNMRQRESYQREFYKKHGWEERENAANFILTLEK